MVRTILAACSRGSELFELNDLHHADREMFELYRARDGRDYPRIEIGLNPGPRHIRTVMERRQRGSSLPCCSELIYERNSTR